MRKASFIGHRVSSGSSARLKYFSAHNGVGYLSAWTHDHDVGPAARGQLAHPVETSGPRRIQGCGLHGVAQPPTGELHHIAHRTVEHQDASGQNAVRQTTPVLDLNI